MATTTFSSWAAVRDALLDAMARRDFSRQSANVAGSEISWSSFAELREAIEYAEFRAAREAGGASYRVYARQGGRGA